MTNVLFLPFPFVSSGVSKARDCRLRSCRARVLFLYVCGGARRKYLDPLVSARGNNYPMSVANRKPPVSGVIPLSNIRHMLLLPGPYREPTDILPSRYLDTLPLLWANTLLHGNSPHNRAIADDDIPIRLPTASNETMCTMSSSAKMPLLLLPTSPTIIQAAFDDGDGAAIEFRT